MSSRLIENLRYWVEYIGAGALIAAGISVLRDGNPVGVVLLVIGVALLFVAGISGRTLRAGTADDLVKVPSIHDDGSLQ